MRPGFAGWWIKQKTKTNKENENKKNKTGNNKRKQENNQKLISTLGPTF